jgi:hypothetical protein
VGIIAVVIFADAGTDTQTMTITTKHTTNLFIVHLFSFES